MYGMPRSRTASAMASLPQVPLSFGPETGRSIAQLSFIVLSSSSRPIRAAYAALAEGTECPATVRQSSMSF